MSTKELLDNSTSSASGTNNEPTAHDDGAVATASASASAVTTANNAQLPATRPRTWNSSMPTSNATGRRLAEPSVPTTKTTTATTSGVGASTSTGPTTPAGAATAPTSATAQLLKLGSSNPTTLEEHRRSSYVGRDSAPPTATAANLSRREAEQRMATIRQHYYPEGEWGWAVVACAAFVNALTFGLQLNFAADIHRHIVQRYGRDHYFTASSAAERFR